MDLSSALIGSVFIILTGLPIYLINRSTKKKKEILMQNCKHELGITEPILEYDIWNSNESIIALTETKLFFAIKNDANFISQSIFVQDIISCKTRKEFANQSATHGNKVIKGLFLDITLNDTANSVSVPFFQLDSKNFMITNEINLADKWVTKMYQLHQS